LAQTFDLEHWRVCFEACRARRPREIAPDRI
jgi:hypothetical protein